MSGCGSCQRCEWSEETSCKSYCEHECQSSCEKRSQGCHSSCEKSCQTVSERCHRCESCERCETIYETNKRNNSSPSIPSSITVSSPVKPNIPITINWGSSSDRDNNLRGYKLLRSIDNGSYNQVYSGSNTAYTDTITKAETVKYKVCAFDEYTSSGYRETEIIRVINNQAPTISGYNNDLGNKTDDFTVDYVITDSDNDTCTVDILVDGVKKVSSKAVTLGYRHSYNVNINDFTIGSHNIEIIAKDSKESTSETRRYTFYKPNIAPVISGEDSNLGGKSSAFTVDYHVSDRNNDSVNVNVLLDDLEIASVSSAQNQELQVKVTDEMLNNFEIGSNHTITIKADDLKGGISYRRYTFTKTNKPPVISGSDQNLGNKTEPFNVSWSITDLEKNSITFKVYLDDELVMQEDAVVDNKTYSYSIPHDEWIKLIYGKHEIRVVASDEFNINNPVTRQFTFNRMSDGLDVEVKINEFTDKPNKIIAIPHFGLKDDMDTVNVYVCNNYLDESPTWEDMTTESNAGRAHAFTNESKTSEKWAIGVKITIEKSSDVSDQWLSWGTVLKGIKGGYE